jgi:hypothetical protein
MKPRVRPPEPEYLRFLSAFEPRITALALAVRSLVLEEAGDCTELIYDAYNAVSAGYSYTGRPSDAFVHIAAYARWVNLGFNFGAALDDPQGILKGAGRWIRHIRISEPADLLDPAVRAFVRAAAAEAAPRPVSGEAKGKSVVRAVFKKTRRPRGGAIRDA